MKTKIIEIFNGLDNLQKILVLVILALVSFSVATSASYGVFSSVNKGSKPSEKTTASLPGPSNALDEEPNEPRTESCPLNGSMHTKIAQQSWEKRRPLAIMIENHTESRPQSGLSVADVVYETVAEGQYWFSCILA